MWLLWWMRSEVTEWNINNISSTNVWQNFSLFGLSFFKKGIYCSCGTLVPALFLTNILYHTHLQYINVEQIQPTPTVHVPPWSYHCYIWCTCLLTKQVRHDVITDNWWSWNQEPYQSFKYAVADDIRLGNHNQECHMGPTKLYQDKKRQKEMIN